MSTTQPTVADGTTVTIVLTAEEAERAHTAARGILHTPLDAYPHPWDQIAPFGTKQIDEWITDLVELTNKYRGLLEQFERAGVREWVLEMQLALKAKMERTGEDSLDWDPLPPPTTGPVTITAEYALFEELAGELLSYNDNDHDHYEVENRAATRSASNWSGRADGRRASRAFGGQSQARRAPGSSY